MQSMYQLCTSKDKCTLQQLRNTRHLTANTCKRRLLEHFLLAKLPANLWKLANSVRYRRLHRTEKSQDMELPDTYKTAENGRTGHDAYA